MADALVSGASVRKDVEVQLLSAAPSGEPFRVHAAFQVQDMPRLLFALSVAGILGGASCSASVSSSPTPLPTRSPPPSQSTLPSQVVGWTTYSSTDYGYSLSYPSRWFDLGSFGAADEHHFSNEQGIGSPQQMSSTGVFLGVSANCQVGTGGPNSLISQADLVVGGVAAIRYVETVSNVGGQAVLAMVTVKPGMYCYRIFMEAFTLPALQANLAYFDLMLTSVRFSARTAPVVTPRETTPPTH